MSVNEDIHILRDPAELQKLLRRQRAIKVSTERGKIEGLVAGCHGMPGGIRKEMEQFQNPAAVHDAWVTGFESGNADQFLAATDAEPTRNGSEYPARGAMLDAIKLRHGQLDPILMTAGLMPLKQPLLDNITRTLGERGTLPSLEECGKVDGFEGCPPRVEEDALDKCGAKVDALAAELLKPHPLPAPCDAIKVPDDVTVGVEFEGFFPTTATEDKQKRYLEGKLAGAGVSITGKDGWHSKCDGTVANPVLTEFNDDVSFEVVAPVLRGQAGIDECALVGKTLKEAGWQANASCGGHVHVGVDKENLDGLKTLAINYKRKAGEIHAHVDADRRDGTMFARANEYSEADVHKAATLTELVNLVSPDRTSQLNLRNLITPGGPSTAEFRGRQGAAPEGMASHAAGLAVFVSQSMKGQEASFPKPGDVAQKEAALSLAAEPIGYRAPGREVTVGQDRAFA